MAAIGAISGLGAVGGIGSVGRTAGTTPVGGVGGSTGTSAAGSGGSFLDSLGQAFSQLNGQLTQSDQAMSNFAAGSSNADLGSVMLQMQEASLNLKLGVEVRDGMIDAYRQVMQLQV